MPVNTTILLVDDDPDQISVIETYLEECGHTVLSCTDVKAAITHARNVQNLSLVVADIQMPVADDGCTLQNLIEEVRNRKCRKMVPVMLMSGGLFFEDSVMENFGVDEFCPKAEIPRGFLSRVQGLLSYAAVSFRP